MSGHLRCGLKCLIHFIVLKNISSDFSYIRCNPGFSALLQKKPEDLQGKTDFDIFDRDLAQRIRTVDMEIVRTHSIADNQWFFSTPDGKEHAMRFISRIIKRADGSELILGVGIDITKHESMNSKLRKRNKELRLLLSQQEKPLMLLDNNLTLVGATPNMQKHLNSYLKADMTLQCSDLCRKLPAKPEECPAYQTLQDGQIRYCHNCVLAASGLKLQRPLSPPGSDYYVAAGIEPHSEESHYTVNSEENEL